MYNPGKFSKTQYTQAEYDEGYSDGYYCFETPDFTRSKAYCRGYIHGIKDAIKLKKKQKKKQ